MNQGRLWTVVKPTVGLPLLLGSVAVIAILVHTAILTHTTWYPKYFSGKSAAIESSVNIG
jgi:light-harvesting protein B-800-850 alpha chain